MKRITPFAYLAVAVASTALAAVQPTPVPEAEVAAWMHGDADWVATIDSQSLQVPAALSATPTGLRASPASEPSPAHGPRHGPRLEGR